MTKTHTLTTALRKTVYRHRIFLAHNILFAGGGGIGTGTALPPYKATGTYFMQVIAPLTCLPLSTTP
jgi:hypothetical protein